ncbi:FHA domain-containing protein [Mastigocoleus testarum]|uniref:FHA domain-containing protein n=1 Tax=Mastigocoleus testarum BC008 TaxID=371196 RepID=A0A0V7ZUM5_9CYAN|nr:FHA domain-containing protein [Mastigocoleus testarum]KST68155.1 hypothetical protein BC008_32560 [Mastigocoleus testarum BC008]KST68818.1 hypothetical protein BC008_34245 [Mastigocoleus testarum BC008]
MRIIAFNKFTGVFQKEILLSKTEKLQRYLIGRYPKCDLILNSPEISRVHAIILKFKDNYCFTDLASTNGSSINHQKVELNQEYILNSGDTIQVGDFILLFEETTEKFQHHWFLTENQNNYKSSYIDTISTNSDTSMQALSEERNKLPIF